MKQFVHLHTHTEYSLLDGIARIKKLIKTVADHKMPAIAITDHGNMYGVYKFYKEVMNHNRAVDEHNAEPENKDNQKAHIKAIIGSEVYVASDRFAKNGRPELSHLVLLAKNQTGYKNLVKLSSLSFTEGFYYKPRIDYDLLEQYSEGIICFSACLAGDIPQFIMAKQYDEAEKLALRLKNMFKDDFYIELQNHKMPEQIGILEDLVVLAKKLDIQLVATNDVHYIYKEDAQTQDILMCLQMGKQYDDPNRMKFPGEEFYLKTRQEMEEVLGAYPEALDNTLTIANKCEQVHLKEEKLIPSFTAPEGFTPTEYLRKIVAEGLVKRYGTITQEIQERTDMELSIIERMGFVDYFLIVWDFIRYARSINVIVGPGRGSGAGSIVAYVLWITNIEPLRYNLLFERFLNPDRISMPDFDVDFSSDGRDYVIDYVVEKYGANKTSQIITYGTMASKAAVKDVARVLGIPASEANALTKKMDLSKIKTDAKIKYVFGLGTEEENKKYANPELVQIYSEDPRIKKVVDLAIKLEGVPRHTGQHPAGVIICKYPLDEHIPLALAKTPKGDKVTTQFDFKESEELGLLKMDFLGIRTLTDIQKALQIIKEVHGVDINIEEINLDDPKVYQTIGAGDTDLVFQLESGGFKKFMKELKPDCIEDIIAGVSLYRPGPMDYIPDYIKGKRNPKDAKYDHPILKPILEATYGVIVYQEQVMQIFQEMAGYSLGQADIVRRAMGKKDMKEMVKHRAYFVNGRPAKGGSTAVDGAVKRGVEARVADIIFSKMESFASYAFNKSHAAAYAYLAYQTAYLKTYYPIELYTANLNNRVDIAEEIAKYSVSARERGIEILPPSINKSKTFFSVEEGKIRFGLAALKNVGVALVEDIMAERDRKGDYIDLTDFIERTYETGVNKRAIEAFIYSGAFDEFNKKRSQLLSIYESLVDRVGIDKKNQKSGQVSMFETLLKDDTILTKTEYPDIPEFIESEKLKREKEVIGVYVSGHPLDKFLDRFKEANFTSQMLQEAEKEKIYDEDGLEIQLDNEESGLQDKMEVNFGGIIAEVKKVYTRLDNKEMAILTVEDLYGSIDVMIFPAQWARMKNDLKEDVMATFYGKVSIRESERPIITLDKADIWSKEQEIKNVSLEEKVKNLPTKLYLKFDLTDENFTQKIFKVLDRHKGSVEVFGQCSKQNQLFKINKLVEINTRLLAELKAFIEENCIKVV